MKTRFGTILVCLLGVVLLVACSPNSHSIHPDADVSNPVTSIAQPPAPASSVSSGSSADASSSASSAAPVSSTSSANPNVEHSITGTIDDVAMGKVYLKTEEGQVIGFDYTTADISGWEDSKPGAPITVYFKGTLNGNDTSNITVTRIVTP